MNIKSLFMRHRLTIKRCITVIAVFSLVLSNVQMALAATLLTTQRDYLNRQKVDLGASDGVQHEVFFTVSSGGTLTNGKVKLTFPNDANNNTKWCRTVGSDLTVTQIQDPTGAIESASASTMGTLAGSCAQGSPDTITVTFTGTINNATKYGIRIANGSTAKLGTRSTAANNVPVTLSTLTSGDVVTDTNIMALSIIGDDQLVVTAVVDVTLSVTLSGTSVALGTLASTTIAKGSVSTQISTSAANGYVSLVKYDQTLTAGSFTIPAETGGGTITEGVSEYGASSSDTSGAANALADWSPTNCTTGVTGATNATALTTSFQDYASNTTAVTNESTTLCFIAAISGAQQPGTYTSTATLVTTARF